MHGETMKWIENNLSYFVFEDWNKMIDKEDPIIRLEKAPGS